MNKVKMFLALLVLSVTSLFFVRDIYGIFTIITFPSINIFTITRDASYIVIHETMNIDGTTYTEHSRSSSTGQIGAQISPGVLTLTGFDSPAVQTVTLETFEGTVITYRYPRKQYTLTINDSNYVTTTTPSGTYYYGETIHLVADPTDGDGIPFVKWSDNTTNRDYTFTITGDTTIGPLYSEGYIITFEPNNGDSQITQSVAPNNSIGTFPIVTYDDCVGTTGSYELRNCTYAYSFKGWYTEPEFTNQVDETYVPTGDTTLYAKWNKIYYRNDGPVVFDGTNYINTEIELFNEENAHKNFIVTFTVDQYTGYNPDNNKDKRATIFGDMNENDPYLGVQFFHDDNKYYVNVNSSKNAIDRVKNGDTGYQTGQKVIMKRENNIVYYSYDNGVTFNSTVNFSSFNSYFDYPATFGAGLDANKHPWRYLIGTLSDMSVEIIEPKYYAIHFDPNGGTGLMANQSVMLGSNPTLSPNAFSKEGASFAGWNTEPDGTGTSYPNGYAIVSDLGNENDVVTLYAQWSEESNFYVHFDSNGGTGTMNDQRFTYGAAAVPLTENQFTRTNYVFRGWNTEPDGTGTHYDDMESVSDLSDINGDIVTLYADWWKVQYSHPGDIVFDGTQSTFIDTGLNIFSSENINKDFEIRFTFKSIDSDQMDYIPGSPKQPTIFNAKDESNNKYPGINVRFNGNITTLNPTYRWGGNTSNIPSGGINVSNAPIEFIYTRKTVNDKKVIYIEYKYGEYDSGEKEMFKQDSWTLNQPFATNVAFGGYFDGNNNPGRFFKGTLADITVLIDE